MLKVAIIGCGKIADSHAAQIQRIEDCKIVAVCDREELMAKQLAERFEVTGVFQDVKQLLKEARPDVVHITTPPQGHLSIAKTCLSHGSHVYVEKPFTIDTAEAEELIEFAEKKGLRVTAGHDDQFRHVARRMRELIKTGYLGGAPVHMESYYGYELGETGYAKALLADKEHWVRKLPGGLLQNIISHGIARIAEFLTTDCPHVIAHGFVSPLLRKLGEKEIMDEVRVIVSEERLTAYFTFSSQMRPCLHQFRIFGPKNGIVIDQDNETLIRLRGKRRKSYLEQFVSPLELGMQYASNSWGNVKKFLASDFHPKAGMKHLIEAFYDSIRENGSPPVPYREILATSRVMDKIFEQISSANQDKVKHSSINAAAVAYEAA